MQKQTKGRAAKEELDRIKHDMAIGRITYDEARDQAKGPLAIINEEMSRIARAHGRTHRRVSFIGFMR